MDRPWKGVSGLLQSADAWPGKLVGGDGRRPGGRLRAVRRGNPCCRCRWTVLTRPMDGSQGATCGTYAGKLAFVESTNIYARRRSAGSAPSGRLGRQAPDRRRTRQPAEVELLTRAALEVSAACGCSGLFDSRRRDGRQGELPPVHRQHHPAARAHRVCTSCERKARGRDHARL